MAELWTAAEISEIEAAIQLKPGLRREPVPMPASPKGNLPSGLANFRRFPLLGAACVTMAEVDLSHARAPRNAFGAEQTIQLRDVLANRCVLDRAGKFHRIAGHYTDCSFRRISTEHAAIEGTFIDCDFSGANFKNAHFNARFVRCRFHDCNLHLASWPSTFEDCSFEGARIHEIFDDIRAAAFASDRVTFKVTMNKVIQGEAS